MKHVIRQINRLSTFHLTPPILSQPAVRTTIKQHKERAAVERLDLASGQCQVNHCLPQAAVNSDCVVGEFDDLLVLGQSCSDALAPHVLVNGFGQRFIHEAQVA